MVCYSISSVCGREGEVTGSLILDDGTEFKGYLFGAATSVPGEVGESKIVQLIGL